MRIASLTLSSFWCFGPEPTTLALEGLTTLVGANGSGKSAVLVALARMFGVAQEERQLQRTDFHIPKGTDPDQVHTQTLWLEARLEFPEFENEDEPDDALAECFRHMVITGPDAAPFCRIRLDGTWERTNQPDGDIEQTLSWLKVPVGSSDEDKQRLGPHERSRIHVHYLPATRDPAQLLRGVATATLRRLLRSVTWSEEVEGEVRDAAEGLRAALEKEPGVQQIETAVTGAWADLERAQYYKQVRLRPSASRLDEVVRQIAVVLSPGPTEPEEPVDRLSDGLKSLFFLSLATAAFKLEAEYLNQQRDPPEVDRAAPAFVESPPPTLTVFAVEEPENHLSPFYLGRIVRSFRDLLEAGRAQVVFSSHSPAIMRRVCPEEVRYLRLANDHCAIVRKIPLPTDDREAHKYVREAVQAHPELYFARLVLLGEGDSEKIVIPRLAQAFGLDLDPSFVAVVPLGGRHVNHFWRLLNGLGIPHLTLLDLDRERQGGGWARVHYALAQLLANGSDRDTLLAIRNRDGTNGVLPEESLARMPGRDVSKLESMASWIGRLEHHRVLFSAPLDLDFAMLQAFPEAYQGTAARGPRMPDEGTEEYAERLKKARNAALKEHGDAGVTYAPAESAAFIWYEYLFLGRAKPTTHWQALQALDDEELREGCPESLRHLLQLAAGILEQAWAHGHA